VWGLSRRTWIVPNAVNAVFFAVQRQPAVQPTLLCVANISPWKNQVAMIKALDPLAATRSFALRFLGSADCEQPYDREFLSLVKQRPWCVHAGPADPAGVCKSLELAAMLVLPSLEENCPMAVLEAMAAGVPVAASTAGGIPDLIEHGRNGVLFDPGDADSLRTAVCRILDDPAAARSRAMEAKRWAHDTLRPEVVARRHLQVYRELLSRDS
jgi:glycogen(starch) synthase